MLITGNIITAKSTVSASNTNKTHQLCGVEVYGNRSIDVFLPGYVKNNAKHKHDFTTIAKSNAEPFGRFKVMISFVSGPND